MNRLIKFRGKKVDTNEFVYGSLVNNLWTYSEHHKWHKKAVCEIIKSEECSDYEEMQSNEQNITVDPETVGQYTGLKDKNGKEIYEGDVVRWGCGFTGSYDSELWHRHAVVELFPSLQFKIIKYYNINKQEFEKGDNYVFGYANFIYKETDKYLEIIGNIHENPELL